MNAPLLPPKLPHVGQSPVRVDADAKVRGTTRYVDDLPFDGWHGATVRTPIARGKVKAVRFLEGPDWREFVIVTAKDIPASVASVHAPDTSHGASDGPVSNLVDLNMVQLIERDQPYLVRSEFRHKYEPVVLLAHPDPDVLRWAATRVHVECEALPAYLDYTQLPVSEQIQRGTDNSLKSLRLCKGAGESEAELEAVFANAFKVVEGVYHTGAQEQAYIEPQGMIARVELHPHDQMHPHWPKQPFKVRIEGSMQCPFYVHTAIKHLTNLPDDAVEIAQTATGGGFGGKEDYPSIIAGHATLLAMKARRPIKIIYDRVEDMQATTKRHPCETRIRTAHDQDGKLLALQAQVRMDGGAYLTLTPVVLSRGTLHIAGPYQIPNVRIESKAVLTNTAPNGAFRGFGAPQTIFAMERHLDKAAKALGITGDVIRKRNFVVQGGTLSTGQVIGEAIDYAGWLAQVQAELGWSEKYKQYQDFNAEQTRAGGMLRRGLGLSSFMHGCGFTGSGEVALDSRCKVRVTAEGKVEVCVANTEIGQGATTIFAQIAADALGLSLGDVCVARPDTKEVPNSGPTVASRTSMVVGHLVARACDDLVLNLEKAGLLSGELAHPSAVPAPSALSVARGTTWQPTALRKALKAAAEMPANVKEGWSRYEPPPGVIWDDSVYKGVAYGTYAWAVYGADVEVDTTTMEVKVLDFVAFQEVGRVLNPTLAVGQIAGGVVQGLGWALWEDVRLDAQGGMANANLTSYVIPTMADVPTIRVFFAENPYNYGPFGAKGIGELPMDGPAPAVCNALSMALDAPIDAIPATAEALLAATLK